MAKRRAAGISSLGELEEVASRHTSARVWSYIEGAAAAGWTDRENRAAFDRWVLRPRILSSVHEVDLRASMLGADVAAPVFVAPTAYQGLVHSRGELATASAAARAGLLAVFSTLSSRSLEEIARAKPTGPRWFQLYLQPKWAATRALVRRAETAGYSALVLTADVPVLGVRDGQLKTGFAIDSSLPLGNGPRVVPPSRGPVRWGDRYSLRPAFPESWEVVDRLREMTELPVVVKGVLHPDDARRAAQHGARAIVVSNHGGRQLDRSPSSLSVLPSVVKAVGDRVEVYLDGGVRRGSDVLIALALGAKAVGVGRPPLWALAAGGEAGVDRYFSLLLSDLASALVLTGRPSIAAVDRSLVAQYPE